MLPARLPRQSHNYPYLAATQRPIIFDKEALPMSYPVQRLTIGGTPIERFVIVLPDDPTP